MSRQYYDIRVDDELRRIHLAGATRASSPPSEFIEPEVMQSPWRTALDCFLLLLFFLLVPAWFYSIHTFTVIAALAGSILVGGYWRLLWRIMEIMGPSDGPHVISVIQAPPEMHCPTCGGTQIDGRYCAWCGTDMDEAYRKMLRLMTRYVVEETDGCRKSLEKAMRVRVQQVAREQARAVQDKLVELQQAYIDEIQRQRERIETLERLLISGSQYTRALPGPRPVESLRSRNRPM